MTTAIAATFFYRWKQNKQESLYILTISKKRTKEKGKEQRKEYLKRKYCFSRQILIFFLEIKYAQLL